MILQLSHVFRLICPLLVVTTFLLMQIPSSHSVECVLCDSFLSYCDDLDASSCVGARCATRTAILPQGFTRLQKLCVSAEVESGCRDALLWEGRMGRECVCDEKDFCNSSSFFSSLSSFFTLSASFLLVYLRIGA